MKTDIENVIKKLESVKDIPKTKRGGVRHTWKPLLDATLNKGYFKISEDDISIQSALNGLKKEAERQNVKVALNTRKLNGKLWLFIQTANLKK